MFNAVIAAIITIIGVSVIIFCAVGVYRKMYEEFNAADEHNGFYSLARLTDIITRSETDNLWSFIYICISDSSDLSENFMYGTEQKMLAFANDAGGVSKCENGRYIIAVKKDISEIKDFMHKFSNGNDGIISDVEMHIGIYTRLVKEMKVCECIENARKGCMYAKKMNQSLCIADAGLLNAIKETEFVTEGIEKFICNNDFYAVIQPFVSAKGKIVGGEFLSRLPYKDYKTVSPAKFLEAIEKKDLFLDFDLYVFENFCKWLYCHQNSDIGVISCNIARISLSHEEFRIRCEEVLKKYPIDCSKAAVEITEDNIFINDEVVIKNVSYLKEKGFKIFLDDFGMGSTTINDLFHFSVDVVKFDKDVFYTALESGKKEVIKDVIQMFKRFGVKILCEGIETELYRDYAIEAGADVLQGFYYYKPMAVSAYEDLVLGDKKAETV